MPRFGPFRDFLIPIVLLILMAVFLVFARYDLQIIDQFESGFVHPSFTPEHRISQTFSAPLGLTSLRLKWATFSRVVPEQCSVEATLSRISAVDSVAIESASLLKTASGDYHAKLGAESLQDNAMVTLVDSPSTPFPGGTYLLELTPGDGCAAMTVSPWFSLSDSYHDGTLLLDGRTVHGDLTFEVKRSLTFLEIFVSSLNKFRERTDDVTGGILSGLCLLVVLFSFFVLKKAWSFNV